MITRRQSKIPPPIESAGGSNIGLADPVGPQFGDLWERLARRSCKTYRSYLEFPGRLIFLLGRPEQNLVDVHLVGLADRKGHDARE
jgi:hypothetical protein